MYSLNVPVPGRVSRVASDLYPDLVGFERVRDRHSLVLKRLGEADHPAGLADEVRRALRGAPAVEVGLTGIDFFADPPVGSAPVVYLGVAGPGLTALHERLVEAFGAVDGLEGEEYVPHVTIARGGSLADAERLAAREVPDVAWTVSALELVEGTHRERVRRFSLPG